MIKDVIVIGGGASGMMAALTAAKLNPKTLLLERNNCLGKKLLITGKGRSNITNSGDIKSFIASFGKRGSFLYRALTEFSNNDLVAFFEGLGIKTKTERGGRIFPQSDRSQDIVAGLRKSLENNRCEIILDSRVKSVNKENPDFKVALSDGRSLASKQLIIATGGLSYPLTGSTGDGYDFARKFGHSVIELYPALVPLETKESFPGKLQGLSLKNVSVNVFSGGRKIAEEFGEMLFTHFGVSGPIILKVSGEIVEELNKGKNVYVSINLKPALSKEILTKRLLRELDSSGKAFISNILKNLIPKALVPVFLSLSKISSDKQAHQITRSEREKIYSLLTDFRLEIARPRSFNEAIITSGGISLNEINPYTMESKKVKGLFFCGEIIDIHGITGGYNLQEAFSTGFLAGKSAAETAGRT